jgi:hypothetical protein
VTGGGSSWAAGFGAGSFTSGVGVGAGALVSFARRPDWKQSDYFHGLDCIKTGERA